MKILFFLSLVSLTIKANCSETVVNTNVQEVTIYHSGAMVKRTSDVRLEEGLNELVFHNLSAKIVLNSLKILNDEVTILNKSIVRKLRKEELNQLEDKKQALSKELSLIENKYAENGFVSNVEDLEKMTRFYTLKVQQIKREMRETARKMEEAKALEGIELKNENAAILKLIVSVDEGLKEAFAMEYVCGGIGWSPFYEVSVESPSSKLIEVKYLARAMSQTGEDWENVTLSLSSSFPLEAPNTLPKPLEPWSLNGGRNLNLNKQDDKENKTDNKNGQDKIDKLEGVQYEEIAVPSFLALKTLKGKYSLKSNSTVFTFPITKVDLPAKFYYYGFPSLDPEVYLVAQITDWNSFGFVDGVANVTFKGNNIGKSVVKFSDTKDTLLLPIGRDNSVFMKRSEIADEKYFKPASVGKKVKTTLAYSFEIQNNNPFPIEFALYDQIPITQTKLASVEIEEKSGGQIDSQLGEVAWLFELNSGESSEKELIFTMETDGGKGSQAYGWSYKKKRYRTVSAPSF